jgi:hypothetical protein
MQIQIRIEKNGKPISTHHFAVEDEANLSRHVAHALEELKSRDPKFSVVDGEIAIRFGTLK